MNLIKKPLLGFSISTAIIITVSIILLLLNWQNLPAELILRFDGTEGIKSLGDKQDFIEIFAISLGIIVVNFILADVLFFRERILSVIISIFSTFLSLLTLITTALIISIN